MHTIEAKVGSPWGKYLTAMALGAAMWTLEAPALASTSYLPYLIQNYSYAGDCTVCHTDNNGGLDTVTKAFGIQLMADYGLVGDDLGKLESVLAQIAADGHDTDGDLATDIEELSAGGNPNDPAVLPGGFEPPVQAEYGCVGSIAGTKSSTDGAAFTVAGLLAAALVFMRRRNAWSS